MGKYITFKQVRISGPSRYKNGYPIGTIGYVFEHENATTGSFDPKWKQPKAHAVSVQANPKKFGSDWFGYQRKNIRYTGVSIQMPVVLIRKSDVNCLSMAIAYKEKLKQLKKKRT